MKLKFKNGACETTTASGKKAVIIETESYISIGYYSLYIDDKLVCSRAKLPKILQLIRQN